MGITQSSLSSKAQVTLPYDIRQMFGIEPNKKFLWVPVGPKTFTLVPLKEYQKGEWTKNICGKYADDNNPDAVQSLIDDRKEDLVLEERGFLHE